VEHKWGITIHRLGEDVENDVKNVRGNRVDEPYLTEQPQRRIPHPYCKVCPAGDLQVLSSLYVGRSRRQEQAAARRRQG